MLILFPRDDFQLGVQLTWETVSEFELAAAVEMWHRLVNVLSEG